MADKRDQILSQLFLVLDAIPQQIGYDVHSSFRNRGLLPEDLRPAIALLDGVELTKLEGKSSPGQFMPKQVMTLIPQIFVLLVPSKTPANTGKGDELTAFRNAVIRAVSRSRELATLCGPNGGVVLRRVETDMQTGSTLQGQLRIDFAFDYVLDPSDLPDGSTT